MDKSMPSGRIPKAPRTTEKGFKGGVIQGFPTTKGASKNEVCPKCGCYCKKESGCCKG